MRAGSDSIAEVVRAAFLESVDDPARPLLLELKQEAHVQFPACNRLAANTGAVGWLTYHLVVSRAMPGHPMTVEDLYALPEDEAKYELQAGTVLSEPHPGAKHGRVTARVAELLGAHVRRLRLGIVLGNDTWFLLSRAPDTVRAPDVAFVTRERYASSGDPVGAFPGAPDLAVEVLSPSNTAAGIRAKVADYLAAGTRCVWVLDTEAATVAVYRSLLSPRTLGAEDFLEGEEIVPGFRVQVLELFEV